MAKTDTTKNAYIRITPDRAELLNINDGAPGAALATFMEHAEMALLAGRSELCGLFTLAEWRAMASALNSTAIESTMVQYVATEFQDADEAGDWIDFGIDGASLVHRVRELSAGGKWALCDAIARLKTDVRNASLARLGIFVSEGI